MKRLTNPKKTVEPATGMVAMMGKDFFKVRFPYDPRIIANIKTLPRPPAKGWNPKEKYWTVRALPATLESLRKWGFYIHSNVLQWEQDSIQNNHVDLTEIVVKLSSTNFKGILRPYQIEGVGFLESNKGSGLIADEMGTGKTIQCIAWLHLHKDDPGKILIVCPSSLKINWEREFTKWSDFSCHIINGTTSYTLPESQVYIINYDIISYWESTFQKIDWKCVAADEVHFVQNRQTKRSKSTLGIAKKSKAFIAMSGTPITNRPVSFFSVLNLLDRETFSNFWWYAQRFCGAKHDGFGWDFKGASNTEQLNSMVKKIMIRRLKKDVLKDLPPKQITVIPIEMEKKYETEYRKKETLLFGETDSKALDIVEALKQAAFKAKWKGICQWLDNFLPSGEKIVIFCTHKASIQALEKRYNSISVKVDGSVTGKARQKAIDMFQTNPKVQIFLGNIKAAGVGLTLTASSTVVFVELGWTPGEHCQAEDRCHRLGSEWADKINIYYLIADNTIETYIMQILDEKRKVLGSILDGKEPEETKLLTVLLERIKSNASNVM